MPHFQSFSVEDSHTTPDPSLLSLPRSKSVPPVSSLLNHDGLPENPLGCFADLTQPWAATFTYPSPSASESSFDGTSTRLCRPAKPGMLFRSLTNLQMLKNGPLTHLYSMRAAEDQNADVTAVALVCGLRSIHLIASSQNGGLLCLPLEAFN